MELISKADETFSVQNFELHYFKTYIISMHSPYREKERQKETEGIYLRAV